MRIVFVLPNSDPSGGVRTVATYGRLLKHRGHQVTLVSPPPARPRLWAQLRSLVSGRGWIQRPAPREGPIEGLEVEHRQLERWRPVTDADVPDADVVVATWWETAEWVAALSPRKGAKVQFIQGHEVLPAWPRRLQDRFEASWTLPLHRIACSRWVAELARTRYGHADVWCVPNGVDVRHFDAGPRGKQDGPTVGFVYSEAPIKGCDVAVEAFRRAVTQLPKLRLVSFGLEPASPALPLPAGAELLVSPSQAEIPHLYARCDAWLWPSRREGFGLPILEAMACRTPVIAAPAGAAPELLAEGGGVLLDAADPTAMAAAIVRVCSLPEARWRELSEEARAIAGRHGWERSVVLFEAALEAAIAGDRPAQGYGAASGVPR